MIGEHDEDIRNSLTAAGTSHYQRTREQPIEIMVELFTKEQMEGFLLGNILKYAMRYGAKDAKVKESGKIKQYAEWLHHLNQTGNIFNQEEEAKCG